ncbi:MAG: hypothetical protein QOF49_166, partial [Chloroflexota bacterium]|nr:hypothetical protein [Chloroflexota bacterium]
MNDNNDSWGREQPQIADGTAPTPTRPVRRAAGSQKGRIAGALIVGGIAGAAILGPISTLAASADPSAPAPSIGTPEPSATAATGATVTPSTSDQDADGTGGPGGRGGHVEAVSDTSVVAKAIGISEADLQTALQGGQTVAQVAT